ncbi:MAG: hypothetical protein EA381_05335 [Planctomycetaceae bacterium]|nr:MAG: hypothetical protein EA381_05335 [Planctomycetaceae bacterium]
MKGWEAGADDPTAINSSKTRSGEEVSLPGWESDPLMKSRVSRLQSRINRRTKPPSPSRATLIRLLEAEQPGDARPTGSFGPGCGRTREPGGISETNPMYTQ